MTEANFTYVGSELDLFSAAKNWKAYFRDQVSPYLGERLTGVVRQTILRGQVVFDHGAFPSAPAGREVFP